MPRVTQNDIYKFIRYKMSLINSQATSFIEIKVFEIEIIVCQFITKWDK